MNRLPCVPYPVKKLACALATISIIPTLWAAPEQGQIIGGQGSIDQQGKNTLIQQASDRLSINWQNFDIKSDERVQFIQPTESSIAFNRILSNKGSLIQGRIDANGQVVLINPNGIIFTETASVNVGALVASGLDINNEEFLNGEFTLNALEGTSGQVINSGLLNAATGGSINLLGQQVENKGLISANLGHVNLAAGKEAVLTFERDGLIGVRVTEAVLQEELGVHAAVSNSGNISAQGGKVLITGSVSKNIFSQAVNVGELSQAKSAVVNQDGSFTLGAGADVVNSGAIEVGAGAAVILGENITHSGRISADNSAGDAGAIELNAAKTTLNQGASQLTAKADKQGRGGDIKILGQQVGLLDEAQVDASGAEGGGHILIGGDRTGANLLINNADYSFIDEHAQVSTNGLGNGDGGKLIVFAEDSARIYGDLSARGGTNGDGGFVETSGLRGIEVSNSPDISAPGGKAGHWLIDPFNIEIVNSISLQPAKIRSSNTITNSIVTKSIFTSLNDTAQIGWNSIRNVLDNGTGGTVEIKTSGGAGTGGTIKVAADFDFASVRASDPQNGFNSTLILRADKKIEFADSVTYLRASANNRLNMQFNSQSGINFNRAALSTNGGNLNATTQNGSIVSTGTLSTTRSGETLNNSGRLQFTAANGSILLNTVSTEGAQASTSNERAGNAGAVNLAAKNGGIAINGTLNNAAGTNRFDATLHGNGAALNLSAVTITAQAIYTGANSTNITASGQVDLGAFNSNTRCSSNCSGNLNIISTDKSRGINLSQSAGWSVKGNMLLDLGATGEANLGETTNYFDASNSGSTVGISANNVAIKSNDNIHLTNTFVNSLTIQTNGSIDQAAGSSISVSNRGSLSASAIHLTESNNDFSVISNLTASNAEIRDINSLIFNSINTPNLAITSKGDVTLSGNIIVNGESSITQHGTGNLILDGEISRSGQGELKLNTSAPNISLVTLGATNTHWELNTSTQGQLHIGGKHFAHFANFGALAAIGGGVNLLTGPNLESDWHISGQNSGRIGSLLFSGMSDLQGGKEADHFNLQIGGEVSDMVLDGGAGSDTITNRWDFTFSNWEMEGKNQGKITRADGMIRVKKFMNIEGIYGYEDRLLGSPIDNTWDITRDNGGLLNASLSFNGMWQLKGNEGNDLFNFNSNAHVFEGISGGGGTDEIIASASDWTLINQDSGTFSNGNSFRRQKFIGFEVLTSASASTVTGPISGGTWKIMDNNTVTFGALTLKGVSTIKGNAGPDLFELKAETPTSITIHGGDGDDTLTNHSMPWSFWYITGANQGSVSFPHSGGTRVKSFDGIETINGFGDRLHGAEGDNDWSITKSNSGTLNSSLTFSGFAELIGGKDSDFFKLPAGVFISDGISGGAGSDQLSLVSDSASSSGNLWTVNSSNSGTLVFDYLNKTARQQFFSFEKLAGSEQIDVFKILTSGVNIELLGGLGLDRAEFTGVQDITIGQSMPSGINLQGIETLVGDPTTVSTLRSANSGGLWELEPGSLLSGGQRVWFSNFYNLFGGHGADHFYIGETQDHNLQGGPGDNFFVVFSRLNATVTPLGEMRGFISFGDTLIQYDNMFQYRSNSLKPQDILSTDPITREEI